MTPIRISFLATWQQPTAPFPPVQRLRNGGNVLKQKTAHVARNALECVICATPATVCLLTARNRHRERRSRTDLQFDKHNATQALMDVNVKLLRVHTSVTHSLAQRCLCRRHVGNGRTEHLDGAMEQKHHALGLVALQQAFLGGSEAFGLHVQSDAVDPVARPHVEQIHVRLQKIHTRSRFIVSELLDEPSVSASNIKRRMLHGAYCTTHATALPHRLTRLWEPR